MILIVGGSGVLGNLISLRLLAAGHSVRVMTRTPAKVASLRGAGAEIVTGDLVDRESIVRACTGAEHVIAAAHSLLGRGRYASEHVDREGHQTLIEIAKANGVRHFVYTSAYFRDLAFLAIPFVRIKRDVEQYLRTSGLSYTILRPTAFMDFHAHVLLGKPVIAGKKVVIFGRGEQPRNFVAASDVAQFAVRALDDRSLAGETLDIGGPENFTDLEVVRTYERAAGKKAKVLHLSPALPRVLSRLARPWHSGLGQMLQYASLSDVAEQRFDAGPLQERFPLPLTSLNDWVARNAGESATPTYP